MPLAATRCLYGVIPVFDVHRSIFRAPPRVSCSVRAKDVSKYHVFDHFWAPSTAGSLRVAPQRTPLGSPGGRLNVVKNWKFRVFPCATKSPKRTPEKSKPTWKRHFFAPSGPHWVPDCVRQRQVQGKTLHGRGLVRLSGSSKRTETLVWHLCPPPWGC